MKYFTFLFVVCFASIAAAQDFGLFCVNGVCDTEAIAVQEPLIAPEPIADPDGAIVVSSTPVFGLPVAAAPVCVSRTRGLFGLGDRQVARATRQATRQANRQIVAHNVRTRTRRVLKVAAAPLREIFKLFRSRRARARVVCW